MNFLILGDIVGKSGREVVKENLKKISNKFKIDFTIVNGENAADDGHGITKENTDEFLNLGIDVITSGNHIWDKIETLEFINNESRLLRPANMADGSPGKGFNIYNSRNNKFKIGVLNLMGNVFMKKTQDVFKTAQSSLKKLVLKKNVDFLIVDFHGETTSEKLACGYFFDGKATCVFGTHTHAPTSDTRILKKGTAYQTDIGMCGDYDSVIGFNKENSLKKFKRDKDAIKNFPANGPGTISGLVVTADIKTGLATNIQRLKIGEHKEI